MKFELKKLPYEYDELEPYIDARTVEIHYTKHHQGYLNNLNLALEKHPELPERSAEELLLSLDSIPEDIRTQVKNNGGGYINHSFFWDVIKGQKNGGGGLPQGEIAKNIDASFGSFDNFKETFSKTATSFFGSGWAWLVIDNTDSTSEKNSAGDFKKLAIVTTKDHENPIMKNQKPILVIDLWEHSYYLKYQNRRAEYVDSWWNIVNWQAVEEKMK